MNVISLVSYPFLPAKSGGQKGIALFYKYFSKYQQVTIVSTRKNDSSFAEGYELLKVLGNSRLRYINPFIFFRIRELVKKKQATHLILEHPYYGWLGIMLKFFCGLKLIVHSHNIEGTRWKSLGKSWWRILWYYERFTHRHADYNFFIQDADRKYAIAAFGLQEEKCITVSFGTELSSVPETEKKKNAQATLQRQMAIPENTPILLFNGAFRYAPNRDALDHLLHQVNPLLQKAGLPYVILILGMDIPETVTNSNYPGVWVLGFAEDLELYLLGADVFLNPVITGGGIKTKLVEALAYNLNTVSTYSGAIGIDPEICNGKLLLCKDADWTSFADAVSLAIKIKNTTPNQFYDHFYWANITKRAADFIRTDC
jgi:glycosyltransferase involved in cell wall biosynthesis